MVLDNLSYCRAYTHEHQMALLTLACARMVSQPGAGSMLDKRSVRMILRLLSHKLFAAAHIIVAQIEERIALVIVDSAMALFRVEFIGRGQLADRQNKSERAGKQG